MSWYSVWVVEYGDSGCAVLFESVGGVGVWDEEVLWRGEIGGWNLV